MRLILLLIGLTPSSLKKGEGKYICAVKVFIKIHLINTLTAHTRIYRIILASRLKKIEAGEVIRMDMEITDVMIIAIVGSIISAVIAWIVIDVCDTEVIEMLFFVMSMALGVIFLAAIWTGIKKT